MKTKRIVSYFLVFVIAFSGLCMPVQANIIDGAKYQMQTLWDFLSGKTMSDYWSNVYDAYVNGDNVYDDYVKELQADYGTTIFMSDGSILLEVPVTSMSLGHGYANTGGSANARYYCPCGGEENTGKLGWNNEQVTFDCSAGSLRIVANGGYFKGGGTSASFVFSAMSDIGGFYSLYKQPSFNYSLMDNVGKNYTVPREPSCDSFATKMYASGTTVELNARFTLGETTLPAIGTVSASPYYIKIVPTNAILNMTVDTRPSVIVGDYGIIGDNGEIIHIEGDYIVDESSNLFYNPVTGDTNTILDWTYDYGDRTYTLTLENGDTTTVTYGDEYVLIQEGDNVYNVYYITQTETDNPNNPNNPNNPSGGTGTGSGDKNSSNENITNSIIGDIIINIGDIFDNIFNGGSSSGEGEEEDSGGGFVDAIGGLFGKIGELISAIANGILTLISEVLFGVLDFLIGVVNGIAERLAGIVEIGLSLLETIPTLFSGFATFLTVAFPMIPNEIWTIIIFGFLVMVLLAVVKLFMK